jgi:hypothetical protein
VVESRIGIAVDESINESIFFRLQTVGYYPKKGGGGAWILFLDGEQCICGFWYVQTVDMCMDLGRPSNRD